MKKTARLLTALTLVSLMGGSAIANEEDKMQMRPTRNGEGKMQMCHAPTEVYLSNPSYMFEMNLTPFLMQPTASNLDFAAQANPFDPAFVPAALSPNWIIHEINPSYQFGFDIGMAWAFHGVNTQLTLNWERFHSSDYNASAVPAKSDSMVGPFFAIGPDTSLFQVGNGRINFHFDEINLDYGTFVNFGDRLKMNLMSGIGFARIIQHRFTAYSNVHGDIRKITTPSTFLGAGPELGLDFTYRIIEGFQFVGNTKATLFVGNFTNKTTFSTASNSLRNLSDPVPNVQTTTVENRTGVVPGFEGRLGLAYDFHFGCHYMVKLEAGYQAQIYLNAIRSIDMSTEVDDIALAEGLADESTGVYAGSFLRTISDFSLAGPYWSLDLGF